MPASGWMLSFRRVAVHCVRVLLLVVILLMIHWQHRRMSAETVSRPFAEVDLARVQLLFPEAAALEETVGSHGERTVRDSAGKSLGFVIQTSPESDPVLGFSGPTNLLIAFGPEDKIIGVEILKSADTREHVAQIREQPAFLQQWNGLTWEKAAKFSNVDAVSGATLTSLAIQEGIQRRLGGGQPSFRFPEPLGLELAQQLFPAVEQMKRDAEHYPLWHLFDVEGKELGTILQSSPAADQLISYGGPTNVLIGLDLEGKVIGLALGRSYDNEPYVGYVREEDYFLHLFDGQTLEELAGLDYQQVEGVSGATITSQGVAHSIQLAAANHLEALNRPPEPKQPLIELTANDYGTFAVIACALLIGFTNLRGNKWIRIGFLLVLVGYLGFVNGDILSQAMFSGWAMHGIPWRTAPGLVVLTAAAFLIPLTTRRNVYCSHICPFGAAQQLLRNRLPWKIHLPHRVSQGLSLIPALLLVWCLVVSLLALPFSLVDIEPFDAFFLKLAGWGTLAVALIGLIVAMFIPMGYCRYGCPTGAVLGYLRIHARSQEWTVRDWFVLGLVLLGAGLIFF